MSVQDLFVVLLVVAIWGVNFVALRVGLNGVPPMLLVCLRFVLCAIPAVFIVRRPKVQWRYLLGYGVVLGVIKFSLLYGGLKIGMPAGLSSIVLQTQSFFTLGFSAVLLRERISANQIAGVMVAACGLGLIASTFDASVGLLPLAMCLGSACAWGLANVIARKAGKVEALSFLVWASLVPPLPMLGLSLLIEGPQQIVAALSHLNPVAIAAMLFTAYLSTLFSFAVWNKLIAKHGASQIAPFSLLVPIFGLLSTAIALGEQLTPVKLVAGVLVMAGLAVFVFGGRVWSRVASRRAAVAGSA